MDMEWSLVPDEDAPGESNLHIEFEVEETEYDLSHEEAKALHKNLSDLLGEWPENLIAAIATTVADEVSKLPPDTDYFAAAHKHLSLATYSGRDEEFSTEKFRENMVMVAAWCQLAARADTDTIIQERTRQDNLWGDEFDRKNTANDWHAYVGHYMSLAMRSSAQDYCINMVKACGIAQAAVLMIDRYGNCAPRHYEDLPRSGAKHVPL